MVPFKTTSLNVSAAATIGATLSAQGVIYAQGGNSSQWNSTFTTVNANSASWGNGGGSFSGIDTAVRDLTGNWQGTYTTVQSNSASWGGGGVDEEFVIAMSIGLS